MAIGTVSPRSQQRARVFDAYRGRGRKNNNLWLVYSVKTKRDWILTSDRRLVHWLCYLESDQSVISFDVPDHSSDRAKDDGSAAEVTYRDGHHEHHIVRAEDSSTEISRDVTEDVAAPCTHSVRVFSDAELQPKVVIAMRWLKAIGYAAAIRENEHTPALIALLARIRSGNNGKVGDLIGLLSDFDHSVVFGLLVRLAIEGDVILDFNDSGYCLMTRWRMPDNGNMVS